MLGGEGGGRDGHYFNLTMNNRIIYHRFLSCTFWNQWSKVCGTVIFRFFVSPFFRFSAFVLSCFPIFFNFFITLFLFFYNYFLHNFFIFVFLYYRSTECKIKNIIR